MMHLAPNIVFFSIINFVLLLACLAVLVLSIVVLIKLNKALNIWLAEHNNKGAL